MQTAEIPLLGFIIVVVVEIQNVDRKPAVQTWAGIAAGDFHAIDIFVDDGRHGGEVGDDRHAMPGVGGQVTPEVAPVGPDLIAVVDEELGIRVARVEGGVSLKQRPAFARRSGRVQDVQDDRVLVDQHAAAVGAGSVRNVVTAVGRRLRKLHDLDGRAVNVGHARERSLASRAKPSGLIGLKGEGFDRQADDRGLEQVAGRKAPLASDGR